MRSSQKQSQKSRLTRRGVTVITIDQTCETVDVDLYRVWFLVGERPTVEVWISRAGVDLLGAVTEHSETTVL